MQHKPIAVSEPLAGSARGLGVCDALEVPIEPRQLMWLSDQLEDMQRPLERIVERECEASMRSAGEKNDSSQDPAYELALVRAMRARLPTSPVDAPVAFVGPSGLVLTAVRGAMTNAIAALSEIAAADGPIDEDRRQALRTFATTTVAWVETLADCSAVVGFNFDRDADPNQAW